MSNYLFVFATERARPMLQGWLQQHVQTASELYEGQVSHGVTLFVISHDLNRSLDLTTRTFFKGHLVDHRAGHVAFGMRGWLDYNASHDASGYAREGQFLRVTWDTTTATFARDAFGMLPLMYTLGHGYIAVSDSMLVLTELRKHMGDGVTPNEEVMLARAFLGVYAGQQISPETFVEEIGFVPARQSLTVSLGATATLSVSGVALDGLQPEPGETYRGVLRTGAENIARLVTTFVQLGEWKPALSLSGGYDSRVPLAGAIAAGVVADMQINTQNTKPVHAEDYAVATRLADRFGFALNGMSKAGGLSGRAIDASPFMMWALSDLGIYDYITRAEVSRPQIKHINLTGMGGEVIRGNYNWRPWPTVIADLMHTNSAVASALYNQGIKGLEAVGADPNSRHASELHYMNYRYALHSGVPRSEQMLGVTPLLQSKLVALAYSELNELPYPTYYEKSIVNDLCIVLDPELAAMPYDQGEPGRASKDLSSSYVNERLKRLGGRIDASSITPYRTYGTPDDVPAGPPEFMLSVARRRGMDQPQTAETILALGERGLEVLGSEPLRSIYAEVYANGKWRLETKRYALTGAAKESPVKSAILYALFGAPIA